MQSSQIVESHIDPSLTYYPVSPIVNSNFPSQELFHLRFLFAENSPQPFSIRGTLLRYIWGIYGFDISNVRDSSLRYAAMASGAKNFAWISGQSLALDYYAYLSHFHEGICKAIEENKVDETHLLALHFAITANWRTSDRNLYLNIFVAVMEHLIYARSPSGCKQTSSYIWRYLLSYHRRIF